MNGQYVILGQTLTQIADAIRDKTGSTDSIFAANFAQNIESIPTYITVGNVDLLPESAQEGTIAVITGDSDV